MLQLQSLISDSTYQEGQVTVFQITQTCETSSEMNIGLNFFLIFLLSFLVSFFITLVVLYLVCLKLGIIERTPSQKRKLSYQSVGVKEITKAEVSCTDLVEISLNCDHYLQRLRSRLSKAEDELFDQYLLEEWFRDFVMYLFLES